MKKSIGKYLLIFLISLAIFGFWGRKAVFPDPDAFYHAGMAKLLVENGVQKTFPYLQFTILKDSFTDQHFLFHLLLIPGVYLAGLWGTKATCIILSALFMLIFAIILDKLEISLFWLWPILLTLTTAASFRLGLVKANSLSLIFLFLGIYFVHRKYYKRIFFLSFFYVWTYGGFPLLLGFSRRIKAFLIILSGLLLGFVLSPYFPANMKFYWNQLVQIGIINYQSKIGVGGEWYPYGLFNLLSGSIILSIFLLISLVIFFTSLKKLKTFSVS